jgi:protein-disulfide isomerase
MPDDETDPTLDDSAADSRTVEVSMRIDQLVSLAVVFGFLLGTAATALAFSSGLLGAGIPAASTVATPTSTGGASATPAAAADSDPSITDEVQGIEAETVADCMEANRERYLQEMRGDREEASSLGISGTPSFVVYRTGTDTGQKIVGAQPYGSFETGIESHLNGEGEGNVSVNFTTADEPYLGSMDAPVTLVYWSDYQCPFCKRFDTQVLPQIVERYVESGKVRVVLKDYAFLGEDSRTAALASRCVWEESTQSTFRNWHRTVFENQGAENSGWASKSNLVG